MDRLQDIVDVDSLLRRYYCGENMDQIAASVGRSNAAVSRLLNRQHRGEPAMINGQVNWTHFFWSNVAPEALSGCWLWTSYIGANGYGVCHGDGHTVASRRAWHLAVGPIPSGAHVCHRCDNPPCVNPAHLFLGSPKDNSDDKYRKGRERVVRGEQHPSARLNAGDVMQIRSLHAGGHSLAELGRRYRVSLSNIYRIVSRRTWRHV